MREREVERWSEGYRYRNMIKVMICKIKITQF